MIKQNPDSVAQGVAKEKAANVWVNIICEAQDITKNFTLKHDVRLWDIAVKHISDAIDAARGSTPHASEQKKEQEGLGSETPVSTDSVVNQETGKLKSAGDKLAQLLGRGLVDNETSEALEQWEQLQ